LPSRIVGKERLLLICLDDLLTGEGDERADGDAGPALRLDPVAEKGS
jgi:hypothetical protein